MPKANTQSNFFRVAIEPDKINGDSFSVVPDGAANPSHIEIDRNTRRLKLRYRGEDVWQKQLPPLFGAGLEIPAFEYLIYEFNEEDSQRVSQTITVRNTGNRSTGPLVVTRSNANFQLNGSNSDTINIASIAPDRYRTFTLAPTEGLGVGQRSSTILVSGRNDISAEATANVEVIEQVFEIALDNEKQVFPPIDFGQVEASLPVRTVTIKNTGNMPTGVLTLACRNNNFLLSPLNTEQFDEIDQITIPSIPRFGSATFTVAPRTGIAMGEQNDTITVTGANGIFAELNASVFVRKWSVGVNETYIAFPEIFHADNPPLARTVTVSNNGNQPITHLNMGITAGSSFTVSGFNTVVNEANPLMVGGTRTFTVQPNANLGVDTHSATITVSGNNHVHASLGTSIKVKLATWEVTLSSENHTFPAMYQGQTPPAAVTITVTNRGNQPTGVLTVSRNNDNFQLNGGNNNTINIASIALNGTATFTVQPVAGLHTSTHSGIITLQGSNGISARFDASIAVSPAPTWNIALSPTSRNFGSINIGNTPPDAVTITVTNTGNQPTGTITVSRNNSNFQLNSTNNNTITLGSINANTSTTFDVRAISGLGLGNHSGIITLSGGNGISARFDASITVNAAAHVIFNGQVDLLRWQGNVASDFNFDPNNNTGFAEIRHTFNGLRSGVPTQVEADLVYTKFDVFKGWVRDAAPVRVMLSRHETGSGSNIPWSDDSHYGPLLRLEGNALMGMQRIFFNNNDGFFVRVRRIRQWF